MKVRTFFYTLLKTMKIETSYRSVFFFFFFFFFFSSETEHFSLLQYYNYKSLPRDLCWTADLTKSVELSVANFRSCFQFSACVLHFIFYRKIIALKIHGNLTSYQFKQLHSWLGSPLKSKLALVFNMKSASTKIIEKNLSSHGNLFAFSFVETYY